MNADLLLFFSLSKKMPWYTAEEVQNQQDISQSSPHSAPLLHYNPLIMMYPGFPIPFYNPC